MFKLLKDLTRAPESLSSAMDRSSPVSAVAGDPSPSSPAAATFGGRSRSGSYATRSRSNSAANPVSGVPPSPMDAALLSATAGMFNLNVDDDDELEEDAAGDDSDPCAIQVVGLLHALQDVTGTMYLVETFSELLSVQGTPASRRAFRNNQGFDRILDCLEALAWKPRPEEVDEEQWQVEEIQLAEAQRLCLEVLGWATEDRPGARMFSESYGYASLLQPLRALSKREEGNTLPDTRILGLLLAHLLGNNYALLSLFSGDLDALISDQSTLESKLSDITIRWAEGLPLLWAYLWGLEGAANNELWPDSLLAGQLETTDGIQGKLVRITLKILLLASSHAPDMFLIRTNLPLLPNFILTRIYGWEQPRPVEITFPPREEWYQNAEAEEIKPRPEWIPPTNDMRVTYCELLQNLLRGGVTPEQAWRLFAHVRDIPPEEPKPETPESITEVSTPLSEDSSTAQKRKKTLPKLTLPTATKVGETLNLEVLNLLAGLMPIRTPNTFVFRGGKDDVEGGLEIKDLAHAWPSSTRGFIFAAWVYVEHLNDAITLLQLSQKNSPYPLLQIRILENSQIGLSSYIQGQEGAPEEVVCGAIEALIPHGEWVHFAVGCRKGRSAAGGGGEARIFINGKRVGAVRLPYPVPKQENHRSAQQQHHGHHRQAAPPSIRASIGRPWKVDGAKTSEGTHGLNHGSNEWLLSRAMMLDEVVSEDVIMLMYYLGSHYHGNFQDAVNKFLTYDGATAIHLYLYGLSQVTSQKALSLLPANSALVRAIRLGPTIPEENFMFSVCAKDMLDPDHCLNASVPHQARARDFVHGRARLAGSVFPFSTYDLDVSVLSVGGGVVVLKLIDLAQNAEQLAITLTLLRDMIKYSWSASEEMERIHGFDLLAAILRPKMASMVDVACAKILLSILGISADDAENATVHNSAAYRPIGLEFELWSSASLDVQTVFFDHFALLLSKSQYKRYNALRTFQKSNLVRKLLFAIRQNLYDSDTLPLAVATLRLALVTRFSAEEAIKPLFAYLVSALCQNPTHLVTSTEPSPSQQPGAAVLQMTVDVLHIPKRLIKVNKALSLHRLLVVFLQSNPAPFVALPCLDILSQCLSTPGLESFQRSFEGEGGFALLAKTLAPIWSANIQETIFRMVFGPTGPAGAALACPPAIPTLLTALDVVLQAVTEFGGQNSAASGGGSALGLTASDLPASPLDDNAQLYDDDRLDNLMNKLAEVYRQSSAFRRAINARRIETMIPNLVDFAALASSGMASIRPDRAESQKAAAVNWISALVELSKAPATILTQLLIEQLKASMTNPSATMGMSPIAPSPLRSATLGSSLNNILASPISPASPRRRPSTDVQRARLGMDRPLPLRRTLTGESILKEEQDKNAAWRMIILTSDAQKHAAMALDRKEHWHRLSQVDWPSKVASMRGENGVWADRNAKVIWRMDGSEGPLRMRSRLERVDHIVHDGAAKAGRQRDAIPSHDELSSAVSRVNQMPWEDPFALTLGETAPIDEEAPPGTPPTDTPATPAEEGSDDESYADNDEFSSNKMRLVAKALQAGDVVEEAYNIVRIVGVDALPGLLILGSRNLYLIDGLVRTPDGKVIEADQAPRDVLSIPSGTLADFDPSDQRSHRWPYADVVESNKRAFLFRDVALELYFSDKQNFLVVFQDKRQRQAVVQKVQVKIEGRDALSRSILGSFVLDTVARVTRGDQLEDMTRRWQNREISNFAYLQMLNQHAGRTPNDVTQYPVFPWVLSDYTSQILDLTSVASYRDLSLPMGALTEARKEAAVERYQVTEGVGEKPFHYGTHYSSSMIVCGYMIRISPFTEIFVTLQGGSFDLADRLFSSIPRAWDSASNTNRGDVRELIPEFYYSPMFLVNINHHNFGKKQVSGDTVDDVALPPWALNDPMLFVHWNREALESDHVSRHLPAWIDLTFGFKQRDPDSYNCFHPLSYRGAVDLDRMKDASEKAASTAIIHNFGQTPPQIFKTPHPTRFLGNKTSLPIGTRFGVAEHWQLFLRSALPILETNTRIHHILDPPFPEAKPPVQQKYRLVVPGHPLLSIQYGFADQSLRVYFQDNIHKLVSIVEGIEVAHAAFASATLLITVSQLGIITAWRLSIKGSGFRRGEAVLAREATLCGARNVTCIAVSTPWSLLVTGSDDGNAMVWDMNRLTYIRTLETPRNDPIQFMAVNEANGHIALASDRNLYLFSLNGHPIAATSIEGGRIRLPVLKFDHELGEAITPPKYTGGISFLKREFLRWGDLFVVGIGSEIALYRCVPGVRRFEDQDVEPWRLVKQGIVNGSDSHPEGDVTAVRFIGETLFAGFESATGERKHVLYQWSLPDGPARHVSDSVGSCMAAGCSNRFGLLEPRRHCGGCGGVYCGSHALHVENFTSRYCPTCLAVLAQGNSLGLLSRGGSAQASRAVSRRPSVSVVVDSAPVSAHSGAPDQSPSPRVPSGSASAAGTGTLSPAV